MIKMDYTTQDAPQTNMADSVPHFHTVSEPDNLQQIKSKY